MYLQTTLVVVGNTLIKTENTKMKHCREKSSTFHKNTQVRQYNNKTV